MGHIVFAVIAGAAVGIITTTFFYETSAHVQVGRKLLKAAASVEDAYFHIASMPASLRKRWKA